MVRQQELFEVYRITELRLKQAGLALGWEDSCIEKQTRFHRWWVSVF